MKRTKRHSRYTKLVFHGGSTDACSGRPEVLASVIYSQCMPLFEAHSTLPASHGEGENQL
jgi:hypothetical protein